MLSHFFRKVSWNLELMHEMYKKWFDEDVQYEMNMPILFTFICQNQEQISQTQLCIFFTDINYFVNKS